MPSAPDQSLLDEAIALLEPHAAHPATGELHDRLYDWRCGDEQEPFAVALAEHPEHPAACGLRDLLGPWLQLPVKSLETVLQSHAPLSADADPVLEVERRLKRAGETRRVLERRVAELEEQVGALSRLANGAAMVGAIVAVLGVIGWAAALGLWRIPWGEPASPAGPVGGGEVGSEQTSGGR